MPKKLWRPLLLILALFVVYRYLHQERPEERLPPTAQEEPRPVPTRPPQAKPSPSQTKPEHEPAFSAGHPQDFNEAKTILRKLYVRGNEIYCGCPYDLDRRDRIDLAACGFKGSGARSKRIEWEHVVPASVFGQQFREWKKGDPSCAAHGNKQKGRECARSASPTFARMEADLYNLLPSLGSLNAARSNYPYGDIGGEERVFGRCDFEVGHRVAEPRKEIRGDLARIYFYMDARYPGFGIVSRSNEGLLTAWDREDPMDEAERQRIQRIKDIQGNSFYIGRLARLATAAAR